MFRKKTVQLAVAQGNEAYWQAQPVRDNGMLIQLMVLAKSA